MDEMAELQAQHSRGHDPCGCLKPETCASSRYLAIIERQAGELADAIGQIGRLERELATKREAFRMVAQCRVNLGNGTICRACWELTVHHQLDHTALPEARR